MLILALIVNLVLTKLVARLLVLVAAVVLVGIVWNRQHELENNVCRLNPTFFGVHVSTKAAQDAAGCPS